MLGKGGEARAGRERVACFERFGPLLDEPKSDDEDDTLA
jgi:hypothetical protein